MQKLRGSEQRRYLLHPQPLDSVSACNCIMLSLCLGTADPVLREIRVAASTQRGIKAAAPKAAGEEITISYYSASSGPLHMDQAT